MPQQALPRAPAALPLDPRTLGRPVHLLPRLADALREAFNEALRQQLNRRYRSDYQISEVLFQPLDGVPAAGRWLLGNGVAGPLACRIDRPLVLAVMAQRYGTAPESGSNPPETSSEERVQAWLSRLLLAPLQALMLADAEAEAPGGLQAQMAPQLPAGSWLLRLSLREPGQGLVSKLVLAVGPAYMDRALQRLAPARAPAPAVPRPALARRLPLTLQARLLERPMLLGELLELRPGSLIPIHMGHAEVLVEGSRLFTASVAEHQGKLCLSSFEDAE